MRRLAIAAALAASLSGCGNPPYDIPTVEEMVYAKTHDTAGNYIGYAGNAQERRAHPERFAPVPFIPELEFPSYQPMGITDCRFVARGQMTCDSW